MASQVRPGLTKPKSDTGPQKSEKVIRRQPAYSIRARDFASHTQAGCMAAIYSCEPKPKESLGIRGRPCMSLRSFRGKAAHLDRGEFRQACGSRRFASGRGFLGSLVRPMHRHGAVLRSDRAAARTQRTVCKIEYGRRAGTRREIQHQKHSDDDRLSRRQRDRATKRRDGCRRAHSLAALHRQYRRVTRFERFTVFPRSTTEPPASRARLPTDSTPHTVDHMSGINASRSAEQAMRPEFQRS